MSETHHNTLTLERPAEYQIKVPGHLGESWLGTFGELILETGCTESGMPITTLTGSFDQATLVSLLRKLYSLGMPLISAICLEI
jgi:hypothetical protein